MLAPRTPVAAVTAVRTGCGKSPATRYIIECLKHLAPNKKVVVVRHPMPYGDLEKQIVQRFATLEDLDKYNTTIEEREEYEQHIKRGTVVYAGVDYEGILRQVEQEADIILWDGGNNDCPFYRPDLWVCVADATRPGHEERYFPGDVNFRLAHTIVINKCDSATKEGIEHVQASAQRLNPKATVVLAISDVTVDNPSLIHGKRVCCVEDGPTMTHGGVSTGAAYVAAKKFGAKEIVDPRPYFKGEIAEALRKYPHIGPVIPALGYSERQIVDLEATINSVPCDTVVVGTPSSIDKLVSLNKPATYVSYAVKDMQPEGPKLSDSVEQFLRRCKPLWE